MDTRRNEAAETLLKGKRIFIVEDDAGNLAIASTYLQLAGAITKVDRFGITTVEAIQRVLPIDLILMDLSLPNGISGFDIVKQIREVPCLAQIPVVAVSAGDPDSAIPRAMQLGFSGFIAKPIGPRFSQFIASVCAGKPVWQAESMF